MSDTPFYYVSVFKDSRWALLAGPYPSKAEAEAHVEESRCRMELLDPWAVFYGFGTCRAQVNLGLGRLHQLPRDPLPVYAGYTTSTEV